VIVIRQTMETRTKLLKLSVAAAAVALFVLQAFSGRSVHAFVSGPPASHTNAPGEGNCTECHTTFALNSGNGNVTITGLPDTYTANQQLAVTVTVNHPNGFLYGFQVTALDSMNHPAGTLDVTDAANTVSITGNVNSETRTYIEQTQDGAFPVEFDRRRFTFRWTAPSTGVGPVTFYAAGNGANGDGDNTGDYIYTTQVTTGCALSLDTTSESFAAGGGTGSFNISGTGCAWVALSHNDWIAITSGASGTGNASVAYSVSANATGSIRSGTITAGAHTFTVLQGMEFPDVPNTSPFYTEIGKLSARGVTVGCGSGFFCPNDPVTREQMAAFIMRAKGEFNPPTPQSQRFLDVPPSNTFYRFIDRLAALQITLGCTADHTLYCPNSPVLREQMAAFMLRGLGEFNPPTPASQRFTDVPPANVFYNFIDRLAVLQITLGCTQDHMLYCPNDPVTRAQMAAFLVRAFQL
jgi:hypothetical protein